MENNKVLIGTEEQKIQYVKPCTEKHEPVKIVQGSGSDSSLYTYVCYGSLYYVALYTYRY
jgi:hypothetical protein